MAVEPKEVLEQNRVTAVLRIEDTNVHRLFGDQHQQRDSQNRSRQYLNDRRGIQRPQEQRQLEPSLPFGSHGVDRD